MSNETDFWLSLLSSSFHCIFDFTARPNDQTTFLHWNARVLWRVSVGRIYSSITENSKFDWSIQITWKRRAAWKLDLFEKEQIFVQLLSFLPFEAGGLFS